MILLSLHRAHMFTFSFYLLFCSRALVHWLSILQATCLFPGSSVKETSYFTKRRNSVIHSPHQTHSVATYCTKLPYCPKAILQHCPSGLPQPVSYFSVCSVCLYLVPRRATRTMLQKHYLIGCKTASSLFWAPWTELSLSLQENHKLWVKVTRFQERPRPRSLLWRYRWFTAVMG